METKVFNYKNTECGLKWYICMILRVAHIVIQSTDFYSYLKYTYFKVTDCPVSFNPN